MYYKPRRKTYRSVNYFMPFLIIVCVGVIIVLLFNLWQALFKGNASGDAFMHIEEGSVQVRTWTAEEFFDLTSDALVMEGDEVRTSSDAKVIFEFFDGTIMRVAGGSSLVLSEINDDEDNPEVNLMLVDGSLWFNKLYKSTGNTEIVITMDNIVVKSGMGSVFEVENELEEAVRVLSGDGNDSKLVVDILTEANDNVVESENVRVGQEIVFTQEVLDRYLQYQSPSVISALSDDFKQTDWYLWNVGEDMSPTQFGESGDFVEVAPEILEPEAEVAEPVEAVEAEVAEPEVAEPTTALGALTTPVITSAAGLTETNADGFYVVTSHLATLKGTIFGASQVVVNNYTLQQFTPGDTTWTYFANALYGLMQEGENIYEVYAIGADGTRSDSIFVKVLYVVEAVPSDISQDEGIGEGVPLD